MDTGQTFGPHLPSEQEAWDAMLAANHEQVVLFAMLNQRWEAVPPAYDERYPTWEDQKAAYNTAYWDTIRATRLYALVEHGACLTPPTS